MTFKLKVSYKKPAMWTSGGRVQAEDAQSKRQEKTWNVLGAETQPGWLDDSKQCGERWEMELEKFQVI